MQLSPTKQKQRKQNLWSRERTVPKIRRYLECFQSDSRFPFRRIHLCQRPPRPFCVSVSNGFSIFLLWSKIYLYLENHFPPPPPIKMYPFFKPQDQMSHPHSLALGNSGPISHICVQWHHLDSLKSGDETTDTTKLTNPTNQKHKLIIL